MEEEIWKPVVGFEEYYEISNIGRLKSLPRERGRKSKGIFLSKMKILSMHKDGNGYLRITLTGSTPNKSSTRKMHRLVAEAFLPNPENKRTVNHIDGNKQNNRVENLEWATHSENAKHAFKTGLRKISVEHHKTLGNLSSLRKGVLNSRAKLSEKDVLEIRATYIPKVVTLKMLAKKYNISFSMISYIIRRKTWTHI